jgi:hypothetical protein
VTDHVIDRGGSPDGILRVELFRFYGEDTVTIDLVDGDTSAHLTAEQARAVAADLVEYADQLDRHQSAEIPRAMPRFTPPAHTYGTPITAATFLPMAEPEPALPGLSREVATAVLRAAKENGIPRSWFE